MDTLLLLPKFFFFSQKGVAQCSIYLLLFRERIDLISISFFSFLSLQIYIHFLTDHKLPIILPIIRIREKKNRSIDRSIDIHIHIPWRMHTYIHISFHSICPG